MLFMAFRKSSPLNSTIHLQLIGIGLELRIVVGLLDGVVELLPDGLGHTLRKHEPLLVAHVDVIPQFAHGRRVRLLVGVHLQRRAL